MKRFIGIDIGSETLKAPLLTGHRATSELFFRGKVFSGILVDFRFVPDGFSLQTFHIELVIIDQRASIRGSVGDEHAGKDGQDHFLADLKLFMPDYLILNITTPTIIKPDQPAAGILAALQETGAHDRGADRQARGGRGRGPHRQVAVGRHDRRRS